jgi:excisionase family DNA binding protein
MVEETYYTIPEAAEKLRVTRAALYKWMKAGRLSYVIVGSERRITGTAIAVFVRHGEAGKEDSDSARQAEYNHSTSKEPHGHAAA